MDNGSLKIAVLNWLIVDGASQKMDAELASAKKKQGVCMKYKSMIPARAWDENYVDPFDVGNPDDPATGWLIAGIAVGMDMRDRLKTYATEHGVSLNG
jgi:hypothetical protein